MNEKLLVKNKKRIFEGGRGILAADERKESLEKRFASCGIKNTVENRNLFRKMLFESENIEKYVGGVILNIEQIEFNCNVTSLNENMFYKSLKQKGISVGVKVDGGIIKGITQGIDDLEPKLKQLKGIATFTKWRAAFYEDKFITENCKLLAKYAKMCQEYDLVPIIEPEVIWGDMSIEEMRNLCSKIYRQLYLDLKDENVFIQGTILKISFIVEGKKAFDIEKYDPKITIEILKEVLPKEADTIVFLSGGHNTEESLQMLLKTSMDSKLLSFSFGRALTNPFLKVWRGSEKNIELAQDEFLRVLDSIMDK